MSDKTQRTPEQRVSDLEQAARMQSHMNMALSDCISELYAMVKALTPEAESEPMQPLTGLELVRQMVEQQMQNGAGNSDTDINLIRKMNQERRDNKQS
jgi:hypothetical protein